MTGTEWAGLGWRKSSYSASTANCVEIAFTWRKSSYSASSGNCVEIAFRDRRVAARDSKQGAGPVLTWPEGNWVAFLGAVRPR
jgi:hypothetical protein